MASSAAGSLRPMTELEIRSAIENALHSYCRGIDRLHGASIAAAFHPGATLIDYSSHNLSIEAFVEHAVAALASRFVATQHRISNITIVREGDHALVETYVHATHIEVADDAKRLHTFVGRYIDRFEERDGEWKIAKRTLRNDWSNVTALGEAMSGAYVPSGRGESPDPIWE
jgi:SnoaL-like domain